MGGRLGLQPRYLAIQPGGIPGLNANNYKK